MSLYDDLISGYGYSDDPAHNAGLQYGPPAPRPAAAPPARTYGRSDFNEFKAKQAAQANAPARPSYEEIMSHSTRNHGARAVAGDLPVNRLDRLRNDIMFGRYKGAPGVSPLADPNIGGPGGLSAGLNNFLGGGGGAAGPSVPHAARSRTGRMADYDHVMGGAAAFAGHHSRLGQRGQRAMPNALRRDLMSEKARRDFEPIADILEQATGKKFGSMAEYKAFKDATEFGDERSDRDREHGRLADQAMMKHESHELQMERGRVDLDDMRADLMRQESPEAIEREALALEGERLDVGRKRRDSENAEIRDPIERRLAELKLEGAEAAANAQPVEDPVAAEIREHERTMRQYDKEKRELELQKSRQALGGAAQAQAAAQQPAKQYSQAEVDDELNSLSESYDWTKLSDRDRKGMEAAIERVRRNPQDTQALQALRAMGYL